MSRQAKLMKLPTAYAGRMNQLSNRIFGDVVRPTSQKSRKVVALFSELPAHKNPEKTVAYYPRHIETHKLMTKLRDYGLYRDEHKDFQEEIARLKELRGKVPWWKKWKKGEKSQQ
ncbi:Ribosomal protein S33 [Nesidiocoris tenuis]|uniref:Small ribosomal subunit protein mS33 n=1 Tax=Nesidiocoris tenuis TaxID=355587 RepID=A0ABN7BCG8_9HEMI|nr:Ribosomal protein S33 [Nesidiocoris tenuis]